MSQTVIVRRFQKTDLPAILRIERASFHFDAWTREIFSHYLDATSNAFLVAVADGRVAGYIIVRFVPNGAQMDSLAVLPGHRHKGIATKLMKAVTRIVDRRAGAIFLTVRPQNAEAILLYRKFGFLRTHTLPHYYGANSPGWRMRRGSAKVVPESYH